MFVAVRSLAVTSTGPGGFMVLCFLSGSTQRLTGIGSGFKASQETGPWLKVSSDSLGEPGIELVTPVYKAIATRKTRLHHSGIKGAPVSEILLQYTCIFKKQTTLLHFSFFTSLSINK